MRHHPAVSLVPLLAISCIAAPIADDQNETDQISAGNYAWSANKDAWTEHLTAPDVDEIVKDGWELVPGEAGCAVGLVQGSETIYLKGYGMASPWQEWSYQTVAPVGSISKTITALSLRRLDAEVAGLAMSDLLSVHLPSTGLDDSTLLQLLSHSGRAPNNDAPPVWDEGSLVDACGGPCDADTEFQLSHPRIAFDQMDDAIVLLPPDTDDYSNVGFTALGALIDDKTYDAAWLDADERGYEAYTWQRVGRFKGNDTYKGQMLTLALTHSWRVAEDDIPMYAYGYNWSNQPADAWNDPVVSSQEGWEGPSGGWVMSIGDLARLIESFAKDDIVGGTATGQMTTKVSDTLDGYGQGVAIKNPPVIGGTQTEPPEGEAEDTDHEWWHGGDIAGHVAVWAYWPDLQQEHGKDPFGVALICNKRDGAHAAATELLPVAEAIKQLYVDSGITIWDDQEITGLATLEEVDDHDYLLDLRRAKIVDPPSFYVPLDLLPERVWISVDAVGTRASFGLVQGADPNAPNANVTPLGAVTYRPGGVMTTGVGGDATITVPGAGSFQFSDVSLTTGFNEHGTDLAGATLRGTVDVRQLSALHDDGWTGICTDLARETSCQACADGVRACLPVTIGYLGGEAL